MHVYVYKLVKMQRRYTDFKRLLRYLTHTMCMYMYTNSLRCKCGKQIYQISDTQHIVSHSFYRLCINQHFTSPHLTSPQSHLTSLQPHLNLTSPPLSSPHCTSPNPNLTSTTSLHLTCPMSMRSSAGQSDTSHLTPHLNLTST